MSSGEGKSKMQNPGKGRQGAKGGTTKPKRASFRNVVKQPRASAYADRQSPDITCGVSSSHVFAPAPKPIKYTEASRKEASADSESEVEELLDIDDDHGETYDSHQETISTGKQLRKRRAADVDLRESESDDPQGLNYLDPRKKALLYKIMLDIDFNPLVSQRHFAMIGVHERWCKVMKREVSPDVVWKYMDELYHLEELDALCRNEPKGPKHEYYRVPSEVQKLIEMRIQAKSATSGQITGTDKSADPTQGSS